MKDNDVNLGRILKRLGIGIHVLSYVYVFIAIIIGIALKNPIFIFVSPVVSLILGWGIRWILTGETSNIIPFYEDQKKFIKERILTKKFFKAAAIVFGLILIGDLIVIAIIDGWLFGGFLGILALILFLVWLFKYRY